MLLLLFLCLCLLFSSLGESLMISLHRQHYYLHHSSAQWKPWEALCCLPCIPSHHIHGREYRVQTVQSGLDVGFLHKDGEMMMHV